MDLLPLVVLLCSCLHPRLVSSQEDFYIFPVKLSVEPSTNVSQDTNVTLRCEAQVSSLGQAALTREYTITHDSRVIYNKTSVSSDDLLYLLPHARVSNSGNYQCTIKIGDTLKESEIKFLEVNGSLSTPVLRVNKDVVSEGEEVTAWCSAPGQTGSISFYFKAGSTAELVKCENCSQAEVKVHLCSVGLHQINCTYAVFLSNETSGSADSEVSNSVMVTVRELPFKPVLVVTPDCQVFEGDTVTVECTISGLQNSSGSVGLILSQGPRILGRGASGVNHTMTALVQEPEEFECRVGFGFAMKVATKSVSVIELFSAPTLSMTPSEVFQKENMTLTCRSGSFASERLSREELIYSLVPPDHLLQRRDNGVFFGEALERDFNYTCEARAKGLVKLSPVLTVRPKAKTILPSGPPDLEEAQSSDQPLIGSDGQEQSTSHFIC